MCIGEIINLFLWIVLHIY